MKLLKTLTLGLIAAATAGTASAQTLHIAGSTAFRAPNTAAVIDYLSSVNNTTGTHGIGQVRAGWTGGAFASANGGSGGLLGDAAAILANGTIGSGGTATVIVETYWTGSLAGVVDIVAANNTGFYIDPSGLTSAQLASVNNGATDGTGGGVTNSPYAGGFQLSSSKNGPFTGITTVTSAPDIAFSDSYQGTIAKELATATSYTQIGSYTTLSSLATACASGVIIDSGTKGNAKDAGFVGIVPFEWVAGNITGGTTASNITQQASRGFIGTGYVPQSYLTGGSTAADTANYFYLIGRNEDSGTRIGALSESQFGVTGSPVQFQTNTSGTSLTSLVKYPAGSLNTEPNISWSQAGHTGYATGGNVATAIDLTEGSAAIGSFTGKSAENTGASYLIGYLGITDAIAAINGGANCKALSFSGVPYSVAAVQNGQYTFWTYEHCYQVASNTTLGAIANSIADLVYNTDADIKGDGTHDAVTGPNQSAGILDNPSSPVLVFRSTTEGGPINNY